MPEPLPDLTWPGLLSHWTALAQASLALPKTAEGDRWRNAVPAIVGLQAITMALGDLDRLANADRPGERAAAIDKAEVGARAHVGTLHQLWRGEPLPDDLAGIISDAHRASKAARLAGAEWTVTADRLVVDHPGDLLPLLVSEGFDGDLYLPVPGCVLFKTAPAAFARGRAGEPPGPFIDRAVRGFLEDVSTAKRVRGMRQVYRQFDFGTGGVRRDLVVPMDAELGGQLVPGQAQLIPVIERGRVLPVHLPIPGMANLSGVRVEFATAESLAQETAE